MTVRFINEEYPDGTTVEELALKLGEKEGFRVVGNAYKKNVEFETYEPEDKTATAQEIIDSC